MSHLKKTLDSAILKEKLTNLLEGLDRVNTSRMIIERYYGKFASLEISEGKSTTNDIYDELKGLGVEQNKARNMVKDASLNEGSTTMADQFVIKRVELLESLVKELGAYAWMKSVGNFINETKDYLKRNETYILIEQVMFDLEMSREKKFYKDALAKLKECSESSNPTEEIINLLENQKWIPLVKRLYEYASKKHGEVNGQNPNFQVSRIYSPVEAIDESRFVFFSSGKLLELNGESIEESAFTVSDNFKSLVNISENAKFSNKGIRIYPNTNSIIDIEYGDDKVVKLNNKVVESSEVINHLLAGGFVKMGETSKMSFIQHAISEGEGIKELDFGYRVTSSLFEGVTVNVFTVNENIYIQRINKGMKENSLVLAESAEDAVKIVKDFMNYDITDSVNHLLENEKADAERKEKEIAKVESRIKFILEKIEDLNTFVKVNGESTHITKAKELLESKLAEQEKEMSKLTGEYKNNDLDESKKDDLEERIANVEAKLRQYKSKHPNTMHPFDPQKKMRDYVKYLEDSLKNLKTELSKVDESVNEAIASVNDLVPGKENKIKGVGGYIYQGSTDGVHIWNNDSGSEEATPIEMTDEEVIAAIDAGEIE
jgi:hypothetical protein